MKVLDRRIAGADWLVTPTSRTASPPRFVFASLKGGVGRSTALAIAAAEQARVGRNVLAIDLDLEAPGLGTMLLTEGRYPEYGALDYLVESSIDDIDQRRLEDFIAVSDLTSGQGLVHVLPATGARSYKFPQNYLPKLSRAFLEEIGDEGTTSVRQRIANMIDSFVGRRHYDVVLIDARAGLAELTAGPLLALGAYVLLFGSTQRQTGNCPADVPRIARGRLREYSRSHGLVQ